MKKLFLSLSLFLSACEPTPLAPPSYFSEDAKVVKVAEIPEHGCTVYLLRLANMPKSTVTVCPRLSADTSTTTTVSSGKSTTTSTTQVVGP